MIQQHMALFNEMVKLVLAKTIPLKVLIISTEPLIIMFSFKRGFITFESDLHNSLNGIQKSSIPIQQFCFSKITYAYFLFGHYALLCCSNYRVCLWQAQRPIIKMNDKFVRLNNYSDSVPLATNVIMNRCRAVMCSIFFLLIYFNFFCFE